MRNIIGNTKKGGFRNVFTILKYDRLTGNLTGCTEKQIQVQKEIDEL